MTLPDDVDRLTREHLRRLDDAAPGLVAGLYLTAAAALADPPADGRSTAHTLDGTFHPSAPCFQLNPITWLELRRYGITIRGSQPDSLGLPDRSAALRPWLGANLDGYWRSAADRMEAAVVGLSPSCTIDADSVVWVVLGPPRLHYTLTTGDVTSKSGSADHIVELFPSWASLAEKSRSHRRGESVAFTVSDARSAVGLCRAVCDSAARQTSAAT